MRILAFAMAFLILCSCNNITSPDEKTPPTESSSSAASSILSDNVSSNAADDDIVSADTESLVEDVSDKFHEPEEVSAGESNASSENKNPRSESYTSNQPAKKSWISAYKSFYNGKAIPQTVIDSAAAQSADKKANKGLELRSDMGIDFVYLIYTMPYSAVDTSARDVSDAAAVLSDRVINGAGALANYSADDSFAGEITVAADKVRSDSITVDGDSTPEFLRFEVGEYFLRSSLTITEGG